MTRGARKTALVAQACENPAVQMGLDIESATLAIVKSNLELVIVQGLDGSDVRIHASSYFSRLILKVSSPFTANCQSAGSASRCISIYACTSRLFPEGN